MLADPAVLYADAAQRRCREICEEITDLLHKLPEPRITGELLAGYRVVDVPPGAEIVTAVPYWRYVEFGTSEMTKRQHIRPAIEIVRRRHTR